MKKVVIFFILSISLAFSQNENKLTEKSLWLKSKELGTNKSSTKAAISESELKKVFNFNYSADFTKDKISKKVSKIIENQSSVFIVLKSSEDENKEMVVLQKGNYQTTFSNKKIIMDKEVLLNKGDAKTGTILSFVFNINSILSKKKGSLTFSDLLYSDKDGENQLMELIYIPRAINEKEREIIESYLSLKYGISLLEDKNYFNSDGEKIWNAKDNKPFSNRVTGIGRDNALGLFQKQSGNSKKDGLYIGLKNITSLNQENKGAISNKTFLLWGDNNQNTKITAEKGEVKKMKRIWKTNVITDKTNDTISTQIVINKKEMNIKNEVDSKNNENHYWLVIDTLSNDTFDYSSAKYIKATQETDEKIVFDNIIWKGGTIPLFTFIKAPDLFIEYHLTQPLCLQNKEGKIDLQIIGGKAPYKISLTSAGLTKNFTTNENVFSIENLKNNDYIIVVSDNSKTIKEPFRIDSFEENSISINTEYYLNDAKEVEIAPQVSKDEDISYEWKLDEKEVSTSPKITATATGNYTLTIINKEGCKKEIPFVVKEKGINGNWGIYPNPSHPDENFTIQFRLKEATETTLSIYNVDGKIVRSKNLGSIKEYDYKDSLPIIGTYLVTIKQNDQVYTTKLIIK